MKATAVPFEDKLPYNMEMFLFEMRTIFYSKEQKNVSRAKIQKFRQKEKDEKNVLVDG